MYGQELPSDFTQIMIFNSGKFLAPRLKASGEIAAWKK